ncbi:MAG: hypothetical protein ACPHK8_02145 [Thermoplasmatota archaeon]
MARQPIVLQPPQERHVVVLREGKAKRNWANIISTILGLLLLVAAIALVSILPEDDTPLPQYEVSFEEVRTSIPGTTLSLVEGETQTFDAAFDGESLFGLTVTLAFQDDLAPSLPDEFQVSLSHPNGTVVLGPKQLINAQPSPGPGPEPSFVASEELRVLSFALAPRPSTEILSAEFHGETLASVSERAKLLQGEGPGTWTISVTLAAAGDCPAPQSLDLTRTATCTAEAPDGLDNANDIEIVAVEFLEYITSVAPLAT